MAKPLPWLKPGLFVGGITPGLFIAWQAATGTLAADPIADVLNRFGLLALVFLWASLLCSPLKTLLGWTWPIRIRRMLGLFAFAYAALHFSTYLGLDKLFDLPAIFEDITERGFILVGFLAFVLLIPLAITSTNASVRRLGYTTWQKLHRLVYPAAVLASIHYIWRVKKDVTEPAVYATVLALLLVVRVVTRSPRPRPAARS